MPYGITIVIDSLAVGGAERCAVDMAAALDRHRFEPTVVVTRTSGPLQQVLDDADIETIILGRQRTIDLRAARRLRSLLHGADLVHAHKASTSAWCALLGTGTPLLAHEHNWSGAGGGWTRQAYRRLIGPRAHRTLCVSDSVARAVHGFGVAADRLVTLPNATTIGVARSRADARETIGIPSGGPVIGMVAGLRPEKAHDLALQALATEALTSRDVRLCIIGRGPLEAQLRHRANQLDVTERVIWATDVPDQQTDAGNTVSAGAALASAFDVALVCSDWEGLPLFALEAMAAGTPLVASAVGELPDLCSLERGVIFPPRDHMALANDIARLVDEPGVARRIGARGRNHVEAEHAFPVLTQRLERIYETAITDGGYTAHAATIEERRSA